MREVIASHVGQRLAQKRLAADLSLRDLGKLAHISAAGLHLIESGTVLVPLDTLYRLSFQLGCEPVDLLPSRRQVVKANGSGGE